MYKSKILLLTCSLLTLLVGCVSEPENHQLTPVEGSIILYADQTLDSLRFYTFDNWSVTPQADWISIEGKSREDNVKYDYTKSYLYRVFVSVKPNTTGKTRYSSVLVESYEYDYSSPIVQLGMLNISHPAFTADPWLDEQSMIPDVARFVLTDSAHWEADSICFTVEKEWGLAFVGDTPPDWVKIDRASGLPRKHYSVNLTLTPNTDTENGREATLCLTSGEVTNNIVVRQLPAKKADQ